VSNTRRSHVDLARIGLCIRDEFWDGFSGEEGFTDIMKGVLPMKATGAMSRTKLDVRFGYSAALAAYPEMTRSRVLPSGCAPAIKRIGRVG
jgi:hypothetical protein